MAITANVFKRVSAVRGKSQIVCRFWKQGNCNRNPCKFVHGELPQQPHSHSHHQQHSQVLRSNVYRPPPQQTLSTPVHQRKNEIETLQKPKVAQVVTLERKNEIGTLQKPQVAQVATLERKNERETLQKSKVAQFATLEKACEDWISGHCRRGDGCPFLHSWFRGDAFSMLARLEGHAGNVSGVDLPSGSDKLFSGSSDGVIHAWDCNTGKSAGTLNVGGKIGCLLAEGQWLFVGLPNLVKAFDTQSGAEYSLTGVTGEVYALESGLGVLFAAAQDGVVVAWRVDNGDLANLFKPPVSLKGHASAVICLRFGAGRLYSGDMDGTIKVWDNDSLECLETLKGHDDAVMSLLCFETFLLSCSLDQKIKVWASNEEGNLKVVHTHEDEDEDCGALALCGVENPEGNPILVCSWNNDTVSVYDLPSFTKRGKIYSKGEVRCMRSVPGGLLLTGDASGVVTVWRLAQATEAAAVAAVAI